MRREGVQVLSHLKTRNGDVREHPPPHAALCPPPLVAVPRWWSGVASQMIRSNRQALPPLLPASFLAKSSTSMENTIFISSLSHTGRQDASGGGGGRGRGRRTENARERARRRREEQDEERQRDSSFSPLPDRSQYAGVSADSQYFVTLQTRLIARHLATAAQSPWAGRSLAPRKCSGSNCDVCVCAFLVKPDSPHPPPDTHTHTIATQRNAFMAA